MKRVALLGLCLLLLSGCASKNSEINRGILLRTKLLQGNGCTFETEVTADYGDKIHTFSIACQSDASGEIDFRVLSPESISDICGRIGEKGGELSFEESALYFDLLADGQTSPISAPWILMKALRSGYMTYACEEEGQLRLTIDDSYEENALTLDIWLDGQDLPCRADILYAGKRILSLNVRNFEIL